MKEIEGLGYEAIASVLGIPEGTVGSRLNKARKDLKTSLLQLGWEA
jgi:RNA polymerase sigma-70 factor (ECF subfamily)